MVPVKGAKVPPQEVVAVTVKASRMGRDGGAPSGPAAPTPLPLLLPARATEQLASSGHAVQPGEGTPWGSQAGEARPAVPMGTHS